MDINHSTSQPTQSNNSLTLQGIAQILVTQGCLDYETASATLQDAKYEKTTFINLLIQRKILNAHTIAHIASSDYGLPLLNLSSFDTQLLPLKLVSEDLIRKHNILPLYKRGNTLYIAIADPSSLEPLTEIKFHTGLNIRAIVVEADVLSKHIEQSLNQTENNSLIDFLGDETPNELNISNDDTSSNNNDEVNTDDAPIVKFVNKILLDAIHRGASDIHFEPYENQYRVRFRIDGILYEQAHPPAHLGSRIAARLKVMSQLDISERRIPQDGRFKMNVSRKYAIDFRVSTCPVSAGEKIVMRLLDSSASTVGIEKLGFDEKQRHEFETALAKPQGMILVTGPTGSGKTVTLYTGLMLLNTPESNISTAEDPVELKIEGVNQVNINNKTGLTFATALRAFLRQDPDIIMVGEIRDLETAEISVKAAQTGHLVLSTLHTNSAPETLSRLLNMGVPAYNVASSISLIIAQRLARRLCAHCKKSISIPRNELVQHGFDDDDSLSDLLIYQPVGCEHCAQGYKGRLGLFEVMPISKKISELIMTGGSSIDVAKQAMSEGMRTIRQNGLDKVKQGLTSLDEIYRVTTE